jgi:predicted transcriptional regulator
LTAQIHESKISNEDLVLEFIREHEGCTKTQVIVFMDAKKHASPMTTHGIITSLIDKQKGKVICQVDKSNPRIHHLFINDKNRYNQIRKYLTELENFIVQKNKYLRALLDDNLSRIGDVDNQGEDEQRAFNQQSDFFEKIESIYVVDISRLLDDLFQVAVTSNISEKDKRLLHIKIIELKSKLVHYIWNVNDERKYIDMRLGNIRNYMRIVESKAAVQNYIKEKDVDVELIKPLKAMLEDIKIQFLS